MSSPFPVFAFDTSALSAVRRAGSIAALIGALRQRSARMVVPHHAINELFQGEGTSPENLMEVLRSIAREAPGVLGFGTSLGELWQAEVWSGYVSYGHFGSEVDQWLLSVPAELVEKSAVETRAFRARREAASIVDPTSVQAAQADFRALRRPPEELLGADSAFIEWILEPVLAHLGLENHLRFVIRNPASYPSVTTWVRLSALSRQVMLHSSDRLTALPTDLRQLFRSGPNDEVDAFIAAGAAYADGLVTNDVTLWARLRYLADQGQPVPHAIRIAEFLS